MAVYKVIQDIEAEDKLLGPLSLRQFIYAVIVVVSLFAAYRLLLVKWFLAVPLLPIIGFFGLLAAPVGGVQSSEVWLLAKIRFFFKPRKRIWNQDGVLDLVTVTAPKVVEKVLTKSFTQTEVESRLQALANTIDSRGWVIKNVDTSMYAQPAFGMAGADSQRLMQVGVAPQDPGYDAAYGDDMLDEQNNPRAERLDQLIQQTTQNHREQVIAQMQQAAQAPATPAPEPVAAPPTYYAAPSQPTDTSSQDYWFLNPSSAQTPPQNTPPAAPYTPPAPVISAPQPQPLAPPAPASAPVANPLVPPSSPFVPTQPNPNDITADEQALLNQIHNQQTHPVGVENLPTLQPISAAQPAPANTPTPPPVPVAEPVMTTPPDPAILNYASNDDLNVETIQRLASKPTKVESDDEEVIVSLH
jgi:hypothetical protein